MDISCRTPAAVDKHRAHLRLLSGSKFDKVERALAKPRPIFDADRLHGLPRGRPGNVIRSAGLFYGGIHSDPLLTRIVNVEGRQHSNDDRRERSDSGLMTLKPGKWPFYCFEDTHPILGSLVLATGLMLAIYGIGNIGIGCERETLSLVWIGIGCLAISLYLVFHGIGLIEFEVAPCP